MSRRRIYHDGKIGPTSHTSALLITVLFVMAALPAAAQKPDSASRRAQTELLPAGPFLFERGTIHPTYMGVFGDRPLVRSPDGKAQITITGPRQSVEAWVTVQFLGQYEQGLELRVWSVDGGSVAVLWRPDSQEFALTDNRYSNRSYVLVCGTDFRMGESGPELAIPITDLTPIVEKAFEKPAQEYYEGQDYDAHHFYAKVLRWIGNEQLLVGVSAITSGPAAFPDRGIKDWNFGYLINVSQKRVLRELSEGELLSQYSIKVFK